MIKHIGNIVANVKKSLLKEKTKTAFTIAQDWSNFVDAQTARRTEVQGFKQKVLYVKVQSSALLNELANFRKDAILLKLQAKYPEQHIRDIKFIV